MDDVDVGYILDDDGVTCRAITGRRNVGYILDDVDVGCRVVITSRRRLYTGWCRRRLYTG